MLGAPYTEGMCNCIKLLILKVCQCNEPLILMFVNVMKLY